MCHRKWELRLTDLSFICWHQGQTKGRRTSGGARFRPLHALTLAHAVCCEWAHPHPHTRYTFVQTYTWCVLAQAWGGWLASTSSSHPSFPSFHLTCWCMFKRVAGCSNPFFFTRSRPATNNETERAERSAAFIGTLGARRDVIYMYALFKH